MKPERSNTSKKAGVVSARTGDKEATLRKHYARYIHEIDPQREWIERAIRKVKK